MRKKPLASPIYVLLRHSLRYATNGRIYLFTPLITSAAEYLPLILLIEHIIGYGQSGASTQK